MTLLRVLGGIVWLAVGAATAIAGVVTHDLWWGLPLTAAALAVAMLAVGRGWLSRLPMALGFAAAVGIATVGRPEGDFLIGGTVRGYLLLGMACLAVVLGLATLPPAGARGAAGIGQPRDLHSPR